MPQQVEEKTNVFETRDEEAAEVKLSKSSYVSIVKSVTELTHSLKSATEWSTETTLDRKTEGESVLHKDGGCVDDLTHTQTETETETDTHTQTHTDQKGIITTVGNSTVTTVTTITTSDPDMEVTSYTTVDTCGNAITHTQHTHTSETKTVQETLTANETCVQDQTQFYAGETHLTREKRETLEWLGDSLPKVDDTESSVHVSIVGVDDLKNEKYGEAIDPFCVFTWRGVQYRTSLREVTSSTDLIKTFKLPYDPAVDPSTVAVQLYDAPPYLGTVELDLSKIPDEDEDLEENCDVTGDGAGGRLFVRLRRSAVPPPIEPEVEQQQEYIPATDNQRKISNFASWVNVHVFPRRWNSVRREGHVWSRFAVPELQPRLWKDTTFPPPQMHQSAETQTHTHTQSQSSAQVPDTSASHTHTHTHTQSAHTSTDNKKSCDEIQHEV